VAASHFPHKYGIPLEEYPRKKYTAGTQTFYEMTAVCDDACSSYLYHVSREGGFAFYSLISLSAARLRSVLGVDYW